MNKLIIIGNLTRAPEYRETQEGIPVCTFTVAVNRRVCSGAHPEADYFRVTAWRALGDTCSKYLDKGKKVCVCGRVSAHAYTGSDQTLRAQLEVSAESVEFLSPMGTGGGYEPVDESEIPEELK